MVNSAIQYEPTVYKATVGKREITVRSLIPIFVTKEARKSEENRIEGELFNIFKKYIKIN